MGDDITIGVTEIVNNIEVTAQPNDQIVDISVIDNADEVTLNITPTVIEINVNKGSSYAKWGTILGTLSDQEDLQDALDLKANLVDGKVPASELPSYVDDVIEVSDYASLPATGEIGKIYITLDNNKIYRWSGSIYIEIASNNAIWGAITGTLSNQLDLQAALNLKANDADVVKLTGDQTITGTKSFNSSTSIGIRQNNSGSGYGIYSENASNGFGYYVANNGSGKAISVANALGSFGNMFEGSYNGTTNFYVNSQGGGYFSSYLTLDSSIFLKQDSNIGFSNGYTTIDTDSGGLYLGLNSSKLAYLNLNNITTQRNFTFPDLNGTFALGSGTTNYLAKWSNGNTVANSQIFDNGTGVGIGTLPADNVRLNTLGITLGTNNGNNIIALNSSGLNYGFISNNSANVFSLGYGQSLTTLATPVLTWNSSGNVGIGTTSPSAILHTLKSGTPITSIGDEVFIGQRSASGQNAAFTLVSNGETMIRLTNTTNVELGRILYDTNSNFMIFGVNSAERMRITSGGALLVGTTSPISSGTNTITGATFANAYNWFAITDSNYFQRCNNTDGAILNFLRGSSAVGSITVNAVMTFFNTTSDYRLKQDFKKFNGLDLVSKIKVYDYEWKSNKSRMNGVIAHELQEVVPYAVTGEKDAEQMQSVDYSKLVPILVQAIQELKAEIELLKQK